MKHLLRNKSPSWSSRPRPVTRAAWYGLVDEFNRMIWAVARAHRLSDADAGDVVQVTWLRLLESLDRLHNPARVGGWLATTAASGNVCGS